MQAGSAATTSPPAGDSLPAGGFPFPQPLPHVRSYTVAITTTHMKMIKVFGRTFVWYKRTRTITNRRSTFVAGGEW